MTFRETIIAARRYHALKKCIKHALLTYRYGSAFVASSGGLSSLISVAPKLLDLAKAKSKATIKPVAEGSVDKQ